MALFWADLHNHNSVGYGVGTIERSYELARNSLDIYAFTPHGWWADISETDTRVSSYHRKGFTKVASNWPKVIKMAQDNCSEGRFITLLAHEWHSSHWGDYCILFTEFEEGLLQLNSLDDLIGCCIRNGNIMIPHHCAYPIHKRGTDWASWNPLPSPVVEIFSEHGNSLEPNDSWGMTGHSMGGSQFSQSVLHQIASGKILGFTAGTDNHYGHPASYGEGLTALVIDVLTKKNVFEAIRQRHTYGVTGERIEVDIVTDSGKTMGDIETQVPNIELNTICHDELDYIEVFFNGTGMDKYADMTAQQKIPRGQEGSFEGFLRIELGWPGMNDLSVVDWQGTLSLLKGDFTKAFPYFSSGPKTIDKPERLVIQDEGKVDFIVSSSRTNKYPNQIIILKGNIEPEDFLVLDISTKGDFGSYHKRDSIKISDLLQDDHYFLFSEEYAIPKIKIHRVLPMESVSYDLSLTSDYIRDLNKRSLLHRRKIGSDYSSIFFKIRQKNGHTAWTSPIYFPSER
jgi:hypothetical protein